MQNLAQKGLKKTINFVGDTYRQTDRQTDRQAP